jgi:glycosyltransferase involved in cell wall biosynthesis
VKYPLVSFCMSTYKRPDILHRQLIQILKQEYSNYEIVISDNDPEASAAGVVLRINDNRIKYSCNEVNVGMVKSFNKSIERSTGEFIVMITDDDPAYPHMLSDLISLYNAYPDYGVYAGCGDLIIENEFSQKTLQRQIGSNSTLLKSLDENQVLLLTPNDYVSSYLDGFFSNTYLLWSCCMIKRDIILNIKGMPDYGSELLTDHAFMIASGSFQGVVYKNRVMGGQAIHGGNYGYDFEKISDKYISTPILFYNYLKPHLTKLSNYEYLENKIWTFVGRGYVEYSLMIFNMYKLKNKSTRFFFDSFNKAFSHPSLNKWKYKFYLKAYFRPIFNVILLFKKIRSA